MAVGDEGTGAGEGIPPEKEEGEADMRVPQDFGFSVNFQGSNFECPFEGPNEVQKLQENTRWKALRMKISQSKIQRLEINIIQIMMVQRWSKMEIDRKSV